MRSRAADTASKLPAPLVRRATLRSPRTPPLVNAERDRRRRAMVDNVLREARRQSRVSRTGHAVAPRAAPRDRAIENVEPLDDQDLRIVTHAHERRAVAQLTRRRDASPTVRIKRVGSSASTVAVAPRHATTRCWPIESCRGR